MGREVTWGKKTKRQKQQKTAKNRKSKKLGTQVNTPRWVSTLSV
jgi:hypothetical protein